MRTCHTCNLEVDQAAFKAGTCPHCGAVLFKPAKRSIEGKGRLADDPSATTDSGGGMFNLDLEDLDLSDPVELNVTDTDKGGATYDLDTPIELDITDTDMG